MTLVKQNVSTTDEKQLPGPFVFLERKARFLFIRKWTWSDKDMAMPSFPCGHASPDPETLAAHILGSLPKHRLLSWEPCTFPVHFQN